jgi:S-DNA-T family DNA segregation ATPase FtsK/SpoIIIE
MPGWQNAFVLGPNVRFTRTPESVFTRRMPVETPHLAEEEVPAVVPPESAEPEVVELPQVVVQQEIASQPIANSPEPRVQPQRMPFLPQPPDARGARALTYKLRLELARKQAEEAAAAALMPATADAAVVFETPVPEMSLSARPLSAGPFTSVERVATPQASIPAFAANLPDELFWEVMTLDLPGDAGEGLPVSARTILANPLLTAPAIAAAAPASPAAPAIRLSTVPPVVRIPGGSAIRLYREIGVHHPAIQVSEPEIVPQPIVEAAVVAEPVRPVEQVQPVERIVAEPRFTPRAPIQASQPMFREAPVFADGEYEYPSIDLLQQARVQ